MALRKDLVDLLLNKRTTVTELARLLGIPSARIRDDLRHLERSLRHDGLQLRHFPPSCRKCDFEFRKATLGRPGRCPSCHSTYVREAEVAIERVE